MTTVTTTNRKKVWIFQMGGIVDDKNDNINAAKKIQKKWRAIQIFHVYETLYR